MLIYDVVPVLHRVPPFWWWLVYVPIVLLIVLVAVGIGFWKMLRSPAFPAAGLPEWARLNGLSFNPERDTSLALCFPFLARLPQSCDEYVFDVMHGTVGKRPVWAFQYHYSYPQAR